MLVYTWQADRASAVGSAVSIHNSPCTNSKPRTEKPGALRGSKLTLRPFHAFDIITPTPRITPPESSTQRPPTAIQDGVSFSPPTPSFSTTPTTLSSDCAHCGRRPQSPIAYCRHDALSFVVRFRNPRLTALFSSPECSGLVNAKNRVPEKQRFYQQAYKNHTRLWKIVS